MKNTVLFLFISLISIRSYSQEEQIQSKLDSIIAEADLLYRYEKAVWNSTDLLFADRKMKKNYGGYVVDHSIDSVYVTYVDKNQKEGIARYTYNSTDLSNPSQTIIGATPLTIKEKTLLNIKMTALNQLPDPKYGISFPEGFNPNFELIKDRNEFKLYIIMGTSESGVIPFGNDYLFRTDSTGKIIDWKKFHSRMIPARSKGPNGEKVVSSVHSHLKTTPYITATDICTFRLYGEICGMDEFMVLCTGSGKKYKYNRKINKIEIEKDLGSK